MTKFNPLNFYSNMNIDFTNKVVIVTGGESGIGKGIAQMLLSLGAIVYITGTNDQPEWCSMHDKCLFIKVNFLEPESLDGFLDKISNLNKVDVLINNAGILILHAIDEIKNPDWDKVMDVNLKVPMRIINAVAPIMKTQKEGRILNISSVAGLISKPGQSSYSASKSGLIGLTRASALDLAPFNILVNALCPGTTQTEMVEKALSDVQKCAIIQNVPLERLARVNEIANFTVFLCSDYNTYMTGQTIVVDGGFTAK
jgi:NAD(P)-dependent dehydrogenase (short-subunit alcohol dehydrogenase family)